LTPQQVVAQQVAEISQSFLPWSLAASSTSASLAVLQATSLAGTPQEVSEQ
jgi:hypothetical protein